MEHLYCFLYVSFTSEGVFDLTPFDWLSLSSLITHCSFLLLQMKM